MKRASTSRKSRTEVARPARDSVALDAGFDAIAQASSALRSHLESRRKQLSDEIRRYPTPIARCDEQLPKLIEQRSHVLNQLKVMSEFDFGRLDHPDRSGIGALREFLRGYPASDDDVEMLAVSRLRAAFSVFPGPERPA